MHSVEQVRQVRSLRAQGLTHDAIAEQTGIKSKTVAKYCNGTRRAEAANGASVFSWGGIAA
jgi:DNA-binding NarL/FixJ family response regulator